MIKVVDRYIGKMFCISYVFCLASCLSFYILIDLVNNLDEFLKNRAFGEALLLIGRYYLLTAPVIYLNLCPIITLMAASFTLTRLLKHGEHVPLMASGVSLHRALAPIFLLAATFTLLIIAVQEFVIPNNAVNIQDIREFTRKNKQWVLNYSDSDDKGNLWIIGEYNLDEKQIARRDSRKAGTPCLWLFARNHEFKDTALIQAASAAYRRDEVDGEKKWILSNATVWRMDAEGLTSAQGIEFLPVLKLDPAQYPLRPEQIRPSGSSTSYLSTPQLIDQWMKDPAQVRLSVMVNSRIAYPFLNLILLLIGIPFILTGDRKNAVRGLGRCLLISAVFFAVNFICQDLGFKGDLLPVLAAWLPVALFGAVGIVLFDSIQT